MAQVSRPWPGTTVGDAGPYTAPNWWDIWQVIMGSHGVVNGAGNKGVVAGSGDELEVTYVGPNFLAVGAGVAMVDGMYYRNDASYSVTVTSATAGNVRDDRLVVRKYFSNLIQTARLVLLPGSEAASPGPGTPPALTQDTNRVTYWDVPLARVSITDAGVITLTDERDFVYPSAGMRLIESQKLIADGEVTFDNIPQATYSDLFITYSARVTATTTTGDIEAVINDDAVAGHYTSKVEWFDNGVSSLDILYNGTRAGMICMFGAPGNAAAGLYGGGHIHIPGYSRAEAHTIIARGVYVDPAGTHVYATVCDGAWNNSLAAITKLLFRSTTDNVSGNYYLDAGSVVNLYGYAAK